MSGRGRVSLLRLDLDRHPAGVQSVLELGQPPPRSTPGATTVRVRPLGSSGGRCGRRPGRHHGHALDRRRATLLAAAAILLATLPLIASARSRRASVPTAMPLDRRAHRRCGRLAARDLALATPALGGGADVPVDHGGRDHRPPVQLGSRAGDRPTRPAHRDLRQFLQRDGAALLVFQLLLASRLQRSLGVGPSMRVLPATMAVGTAGVLGAAALMPPRWSWSPR